jgi:hypothetical protein
MAHSDRFAYLTRYFGRNACGEVNSPHADKPEHHTSAYKRRYYEPECCKPKELDHLGCEAAVAQQPADGHQVDSGFQQARRVRVSHRMGCHMLVDCGLSRCQGQSLLDDRRMERCVVRLAWEEVVAGTSRLPVLPQLRQQSR